MLRNNLDEDYLKGFVPGLEHLLWTGETDFEKQKEKANQIVFNDLNLKGLKMNELAPELVLRSSGTTLSTAGATLSTGVTDTMNRLRLVLDKIVNVTSGKVLVLQGSVDNTTWEDISSFTVTTAMTSHTILFYNTFKYYRIKTTIVTGSIDFRAYLTETKYDLLFAYKWLELICRDAKTNSDGQFAIKEIDFKNDYNELLNSGKYEIDTDNDGIADDYVGAGSITMLK